MKKMIALLTALFLMVSALAFSAMAEDASDRLVIYFSVPETDSPDNMNSEEEYSTVVINGEVLGNTQYVAMLISQYTHADIIRIEPETPYPLNHEELEEVATREKQENAYPAMATVIDNLDGYQTVFVGYPCWYADMPRIMYTLFENYDFSGKTIIPFVTSGASGFANTLDTIASLEPDATLVREGYSVIRTNMESAEAGVPEWLAGLGY